VLRLLINGERGGHVISELSRLTGLSEDELRMALSTEI